MRIMNLSNMTEARKTYIETHNNRGEGKLV